MSSLFSALFACNGRLGRSAYAAGLAAGFAASAVLSICMPEPSLARAAIAFVLFYVQIALEAKRLHDIGVSAWWILGIDIILGLWAAASAFVLIPRPMIRHVAAHRYDLLEDTEIIRTFGPWLLVGFFLPVLVKYGWLIFATRSAKDDGYGPAPKAPANLVRILTPPPRPIVPFDAPIASVVEAAPRRREGFGRRRLG